MNPHLEALRPYPFERLALLKAGVAPPAQLKHIGLSIGEPRHTPPRFVLDALREHLEQLDSYPSTPGVPQLREGCVAWIRRRYGLKEGVLDPDTMVLPVNGTREALFSFVQAVLDPASSPVVVMPNPCYQIYEGATLIAGAEPYYLDTRAESAYQPDLAAVPEAVWRRCQLLILCSPGNPTGAVLPLTFLRRALDLAERYDFTVASDECYADIYLDEASPPPGLLQAAEAQGRSAYERCVVFHSLSKRSSLPGLRSGFVAGDARIMAGYRRYRTYHGCAMPLPTQLASVVAWSEDAHAAANRRLYQEKFARVLPLLAPLAPLLPVAAPQGAFYLWSELREDDERFARDLFAQQHVTVLPGSYLGRDAGRGNPGARHVRISLVPAVEECVEAAARVRDFLLRR
jgi:N-succinyldiaminopimelate aminotransferase